MWKIYKKNAREDNYGKYDKDLQKHGGEVNNDIKRRNLILEMLEIKGSKDFAADWSTLMNLYNG